MSNKTYVARRTASLLGEEARKQYMIYLAAKKRWLAKVDEAAALEAADAERNAKKQETFSETPIQG